MSARRIGVLGVGIVVALATGCASPTAASDVGEGDVDIVSAKTTKLEASSLLAVDDTAAYLSRRNQGSTLVDVLRVNHDGAAPMTLGSVDVGEYGTLIASSDADNLYVHVPMSTPVTRLPKAGGAMTSLGVTGRDVAIRDQEILVSTRDGLVAVTPAGMRTIVSKEEVDAVGGVGSPSSGYTVTSATLSRLAVSGSDVYVAIQRGAGGGFAAGVIVARLDGARLTPLTRPRAKQGVVSLAATSAGAFLVSEITDGDSASLVPTRISSSGERELSTVPRIEEIAAGRSGGLVVVTRGRGDTNAGVSEMLDKIVLLDDAGESPKTVATSPDHLSNPALVTAEGTQLAFSRVGGGLVFRFQTGAAPVEIRR